MTDSHNIPFDPRNHSPGDSYEFAARIGMAPEAMRRWLSAVVSRGLYRVEDFVQEGSLPKRFLSSYHDLPSLILERHDRSPVDGFEKLLFRAADGAPIETVLIPLLKENAVSLCLSSQVGCVMGCVFCATGRMAQRRNLQGWEIVDQFVQAREIAKKQGRRVTGAVFMGMGEPFLNYSRVIAAADLMRHPLDGAIAGKAITISTVGLVSEIDRFTREGWPFRLSISLGAATDEKRRLLVPVAARTPVKDVMAAAARYQADRGGRVNLSYVCVSGVNVSDDDAKALADLVGDTQVRLDLIDVTDHTGRFHPPSSDELQAFRTSLNAYLKQPVARRYSGGKDIRASCGSLAGAAPQAV